MCIKTIFNPFEQCGRLPQLFVWMCAVALINMLPLNAFSAGRISNLSDVTVNPWLNGNGDIVQDVFVCIYQQGTGSSRNYSLRATGSGPGFSIKNGTLTIPYSVQWSDGGTGNPAGGTTLTLASGVASNFTRARLGSDIPNNSTGCVGGTLPTARLRIKMSTINLDAAADGLYTGTVSLLMTPM